MNRAFVRDVLVEEAMAYGFTIAFWGSGILIVDEYGLLGTGSVLSYAAGAITGFGLLAAVSFGGVFATTQREDGSEYVVAAALHYLASLLPIAAAHVVLASSLGRLPSLFLIGLCVSVFYNVGALLEEMASERLRRLDPRIDA